MGALAGGDSTCMYTGVREESSKAEGFMVLAGLI